MYSTNDNDVYIKGSYDNPESDSSETPSELEARLYSVLHYNDLTQPLPPEIASEYSIAITGTEVCISVNKNPRTSNTNMTGSSDIGTEAHSSSHQRSVNSDVCEGALSNFKDTKSTHTTKPGSFQRVIETSNLNSADCAAKRKQLDADADEESTAYITYLTWMISGCSESRVVRKIVRNLPYPHSDSGSYAACKTLVKKNVEPVFIALRKMKGEKLTPDALKLIFTQFVVEACVPRDLDDWVAISEFTDKLSPVNAVCFQQHCSNLSSEFYSNICRKFSQKKELVRKVLLKKFQLFLDEIPIEERLERKKCVEKFSLEPHCLLSESILLSGSEFREQLHDVCQSSRIDKGWKVGVEKKKESFSDNLEHSVEDLCDNAVPIKKRKLEGGKEEKISVVSIDETSVKSNDGGSDLHNLLLKHNPEMSERDALFKIFSQFHEFSMKDKFNSGCVMRKHKFVKVFAKYCSSNNCFNTLYCGLIDETLFRELFIFGNNYYNQNRRMNGKAISDWIETLVKRALSKNLSGKHEVPDNGNSGDKVNGKTLSNIDQDDSSNDVIVLSSDDGVIETASDNCKISQSCASTSSSSNIWIDSSKKSACSSEDEQSHPEGNSSLSENLDPSQSYDHVKSQVNSYSLNCPPSWSEKMVNYYCQSWGGEAFDHVDVLKQMKATTKPSDWKVTNYQDLIPSRKRKRGQQCNRCLQWGHLQYQCKEPTKPVVCSICGVFNHVQSACKDTKCLRCGARSKKFSDFCQVCVDPSKCGSKPRCTLCESDKHECTFCPDTWRSYHQTVEGSMVIPPELLMNPRQYCCNCAKAGHLDYFCPLLKKSNTLNIVNSPFVLNYGVEKFREETQHQHNTSDDINDDKHRSAEKRNTPKSKKRKHEHRMHHSQKPYYRKSHSSYISSPLSPRMQNFRSRSFHF